MTRDKNITLDCDPEVLKGIIAALYFYVESQFPPGSADCGQVAREELLNVAGALRASLETPAAAGYSRRMRAMVKEGIRVYFEHLAAREGHARQHECALLQEASRGDAASGKDLQAARARDQKNT
jgi:hypothetical protein